MYKLIIAGIGVLAVAIVVFGCGGAEDDQATAQVNEAQFMKQARATCSQSQKDIEALLTEQGASAADPFNRLASLLKQEAEDLGTISGPREVEARLEPLIENVSLVSEIISQKQKNAFSDPRIAAYQQEADELHLSDC